MGRFGKRALRSLHFCHHNVSSSDLFSSSSLFNVEPLWPVIFRSSSALCPSQLRSSTAVLLFSMHQRRIRSHGAIDTTGTTFCRPSELFKQRVQPLKSQGVHTTIVAQVGTLCP